MNTPKTVPPAGARDAVTDEMVERAHRAYWDYDHGSNRLDDSKQDRDSMRAALEAALAGKADGGDYLIHTRFGDLACSLAVSVAWEELVMTLAACPVKSVAQELTADYEAGFKAGMKFRGEHFDAQPAATGAGEGLTFDQFRAANVARCIKWHPEGIASWSPSDWLTAVTGELGELASLLKMRNRERDGLPGNKFSPTDKMIADELADVLTYLDLLAEVLGVNLGRAAAIKFNEVSERVGFTDRIEIKGEV